MNETLHTYFNIFYKIVVHILLFSITVFVCLIVLSDLIFPQLTPLAFSLGFLVVCLMVAGLCLYGIWQATSSQLRLDRIVFGLNFDDARQETIDRVIYFYSLVNIYFIANTVIVVGFWFTFPEQLSRAEPLAYILTILSALSGYSTRVIRSRFDKL